MLLTSNIYPKITMIMKRQIITWGMMLAAAFTLTNCAKEIENPNEQPETTGYPFEIVASTVDTKTVNDGMATKWDDNDEINLFHAVAGAQDYGTNDKFTIADVETGRFTGMLTEALEAGESYDWYALYPYNSNIATPGDRADGYTYIGHSKGLDQTGYDNMASLKETICPLYGVAKTVASSDTPSITMNHLTSVVAIKVTNTTEEPLTIKNASLTAEEDIVGSYFIDITKSPVVYKASEGFVNKTAVVNVSEGTALAMGESATLYLAIKPFTAKAGTSLTLSVNDYAKEPKVLTSDVTFHAGKIKTLNFSYDKKEEPAPEGAKQVEIVSADLGIGNGVEVESVNDGLLVFDIGENSNNAPKYYTNGSAIRMYTGNTLSVNAPEGYVLTKIEFTFVSNEYASSLECTNSTGYSNGTWSGNVSNVSFKVTGSSQTRITKIVVTYIEGEEEIPEITGIQVIDPKTQYYINTEFEEPVVKALYSNGSSKEVEGATFAGYDMSQVGNYTVTVTYETVSTSYEITVAEPEGESYSLYSGDLVEGDYVIVYDGGAMKAAVSSGRLSYSEVEVAENAIFEPAEDLIWHIAKNGDYWTIYNASVSKYAAGTGAKNKAQLLDSGTDDKSLWTASRSDSDTYEFVNKANSAANVNKTLRRNGSYGFACYSTSTGGALTLYKKN